MTSVTTALHGTPAEHVLIPLTLLRLKLTWGFLGNTEVRLKIML